MPNEFTNCLAELAACESAEFGTPCVATIGTQEVACVLLEEPFNSEIVEGGTTQGGQQLIMVSKALLTSFADEPNGEPPINDTPTIVLGIEAFVLNVTNRLGVLYITTGFPAAQDY
jgi:hypothetical protein